MGRKRGVAIIGAGYIARYHARAVAEVGDVLFQVVSRTTSSAEKLVKEYTQWVGDEMFIPPQAGTDISDIGRDDRVDLVIVTSPNGYHALQAREMFAAGKHVLVEKPLARTYEEALGIVDAATSANRVLMTGHMWRADPETLWVADKLQGGALGMVVRTEGYGIHERWGPSGWFTDPVLAGGGALIDMGVHAVDTARFLLGDPQPTEVFAKIATRFGSYKVDDDAHLVIGWDNGAYSVVHSGWWQPHMPGPEAATRIWGTTGYGSLFPTFIEQVGVTGHVADQPLERSEPQGLPVKSDHCDQLIYTNQYRRFVEIVDKSDAGDGKTDGYQEPGVVVTAIVDAAYRSSREKRVIPVSVGPR
ncbi:MAG: Gfo/Idh/MocA family oxidoreductase [Alkalispirochaeta sp.]